MSIPLWIVVVIMGHTAETIGPVPYDMDECNRRVVEKSAEVAARFTDPTLANDPAWIMDGHRLLRSDVTITCVYAEKRPL